jgi:DNA-binding response OmpR family regulator
MESASKGKKILIVDDEPDVTLTFNAILQGAGFAVDTYEDPLVALSNFRPGFYDLVILDIKMQKMNGFELYSEMLKMDNQVRICFIMAGEMYYDNIRKKEEEEEQYCELDTERFIQKPISNADFMRRIKRIMKLNENQIVQKRIEENYTRVD